MTDTTAIPPTESWGRLAAFVVSLFYLVLVSWFAVIVILGIGWGLEPVIITSGSMSPVIRSGDVVLVAGSDDVHTLAEGTVITYRDRARGDALTSHRIAGVTADGTYRTRGDANAQLDSTAVHPDEIVGVGRVLVPILGLPVVWLEQSPTAFAVWLIMSLFACLVAIGTMDDEPIAHVKDGETGPSAVRPDPVLSAVPRVG